MLYIHKLSLPDLREALKKRFTKEIYCKEDGMDQLVEFITSYTTTSDDDDHVPVFTLMEFIKPLLQMHEESLIKEFPEREDEFKTMRKRLWKRFYELLVLNQNMS
jgi:hypothetical protein